MNFILKHKLSVILLTIIASIGFMAPLSVSAVIPAGGGGVTNTPTTPPEGNSDESQACDDNGTCASCTSDSSGQGCVGNQSDPAASTGANCTINNCDLIEHYINPTLDVLTAIVGLVFVVSIIVGGIQYSTSSGDPQKAAAARSRIGKTILAIVVYAFLFGILQFIIPGGIGKN